jgi:hypothetical protein
MSEHLMAFLPFVLGVIAGGCVAAAFLIANRKYSGVAYARYKKDILVPYFYQNCSPREFQAFHVFTFEPWNFRQSDLDLLRKVMDRAGGEVKIALEIALQNADELIAGNK